MLPVPPLISTGETMRSKTDLQDNILMLHEAAKGQLALLDRILPAMESLLASHRAALARSYEDASKDLVAVLEAIVENLVRLKKLCASSEFLLSTMKNTLKNLLDESDARD